MIDACDACLRRSHLVAHLAPRIAGLLGRPRRDQAALLALDEEGLIAAAAGDRGDAARAFLRGFDAEAARAEVGAAGAYAVCRHAPAYPASLQALGDPPAVLYALGRAPLSILEAEPAVAIVGARRASPYGLQLAWSLGRGLGASGVTVVSGLALGIDGAAHRGCLDGRGTPVGVLAGGPDVEYPRTNRRLHQGVRAHGLVISETPPGRRPFRWSFPARNRLMAGLARMIVVVEAAERSGSLITAEFAQDLGRVVGAVPGRVTSRSAVGSNRLLRDGACVIGGAEDVLDELFGVGARPVPASTAADDDGRLDPAMRAVLEAVESDAGLDSVARATGLTAREVRIALARLEGAGHVIRTRLGAYERAAHG